MKTETHELHFPIDSFLHFVIALGYCPKPVEKKTIEHIEENLELLDQEIKIPKPQNALFRNKLEELMIPWIWISKNGKIIGLVSQDQEEGQQIAERIVNTIEKYRGVFLYSKKKSGPDQRVINFTKGKTLILRTMQERNELDHADMVVHYAAEHYLIERLNF